MKKLTKKKAKRAPKFIKPRREILMLAIEMERRLREHAATRVPGDTEKVAKQPATALRAVFFERAIANMSKLASHLRVLGGNPWMAPDGLTAPDARACGADACNFIMFMMFGDKRVMK